VSAVNVLGFWFSPLGPARISSPFFFFSPPVVVFFSWLSFFSLFPSRQGPMPDRVTFFFFHDHPPPSPFSQVRPFLDTVLSLSSISGLMRAAVLFSLSIPSAGPGFRGFVSLLTRFESPGLSRPFDIEIAASSFFIRFVWTP